MTPDATRRKNRPWRCNRLLQIQIKLFIKTLAVYPGYIHLKFISPTGTVINTRNCPHEGTLIRIKLPEQHTQSHKDCVPPDDRIKVKLK